jgi:hypothetical protein
VQVFIPGYHSVRPRVPDIDYRTGKNSHPLLLKFMSLVLPAPHPDVQGQLRKMLPRYVGKH